MPASSVLDHAGVRKFGEEFEAAGRREHTVVAVMLANGRPEMVGRAIRSFLQQQFVRKRKLLIYDTSPDPLPIHSHPNIIHVIVAPAAPRPIGTLRNEANAVAVGYCADILAHWDSDDWSGPTRLVEQVEYLESSGADLVGYREMLFLDFTRYQCIRHGEVGCASCTDPSLGGEAWWFSNPHPNYCLGTSMCYWRKTWEKMPFPNVNKGEDLIWWQRLKASAVSAGRSAPRMIASIHGANTTAKIKPGVREWARAKESDEVCRKLMEI